MQEVTNSMCLNLFDSMGYTLVTRAAMKNVATYAEVGEDVLSSTCSMDSLYADAGTRKPFRDAYFALGGFTLIRLVETGFWLAVTGLRFLFCCDVSKSWSLTKESFMTLISNIACFFIAFAGMCKPKWGVSLWFCATKQVFDCAGDQIVTNIARGIILTFQKLNDALVYNIGDKETFGVGEACTSMTERAKKVGQFIEDEKILEGTQSSKPMEVRAVNLVSEMLTFAKDQALE